LQQQLHLLHSVNKHHITSIRDKNKMTVLSHKKRTVIFYVLPVADDHSDHLFILKAANDLQGTLHKNSDRREMILISIEGGI
jgi:hypothetical protein